MAACRTLRTVSLWSPPPIWDDLPRAVAPRLAVETDADSFLEGGIWDEQPTATLGAWWPEVFLDAVFHAAAKAWIVMGEALELVFGTLLLRFLVSHIIPLLLIRAAPGHGSWQAVPGVLSRLSRACPLAGRRVSA